MQPFAYTITVFIKNQSSQAAKTTELAFNRRNLTTVTRLETYFRLRYYQIKRSLSSLAGISETIPLSISYNTQKVKAQKTVEPVAASKY